MVLNNICHLNPEVMLRSSYLCSPDVLQVRSPQNPGSTGVPVTGTEGGPGVSSQHGWAKTEKGWNFVKDNGAKASGEWVSDAEGIYWIDEDTFMAKGWRQIDGKWYYLRSNGAMAKNYWEESRMEFGTIWEQTV